MSVKVVHITFQDQRLFPFRLIIRKGGLRMDIRQDGMEGYSTECGPGMGI